MIPVVALLLIAPKTSWFQKLPDGTSVSLVGVANFGQHEYWSPDGLPLKSSVASSLQKTMQVYGLQGAIAPNYVGFMVQVRPSEDEPALAMKIGKQEGGFGFCVRDTKDKPMWWAAAPRPIAKLRPIEDVTIGVGVGAWKVSSSHNLENGITKGPKFFMSISHARVTKAGHHEPVMLDVSLPPGLNGKAYRFKVYCSDGSVLQPAGSGPTRPGARRLFFTENNKRFVHVDLQTKAYTWVKFKGVHTHPK